MSEIKLERVQNEQAIVDIKGLTPLIVHNWSHKAREMLPGGANHKKGRRKEAHATPDEEYMASRYLLPDGSDGFPARAFKSAMVDSYFLFDSLKKVQLRRLVFVHGEGPEQLVRIEGEPVHRQDVVRIGMGTANLRHRAMYEDWGAQLAISFNPVMLSRDSIVALLEAAGQGGVGEWRPTAPKAIGDFGRFQVVAE